MSEMKVMQIRQWGGPLEMATRPVPIPGPGEVLVRVRACGVGLTVLNAINGNQTRRNPDLLPRIPGHEIAGNVEALGAGVTSLRPGDRVLVYFYVTCGHCDFCRKGQESLCANFQGYIGSHQDGGYAEYVVLPARNLFPFPDSIPFAEATAIPDAIATPLHVVQTRLQVRPGDTAVIIGAGGGVGIHLVQMARLFGARVIAVDVNDEKLAFIKEELGALAVFHFQAASPQQVVAAAEGSVTAVVDTVGQPETLTWSMQVLGKRGRLALLTTFPGVTFPVSPAEMVLKELSIVGSRYVSQFELNQAIQLVQRGQIRPIVSATAALADAETLHMKLRAQTLLGRAAIVFGPQLGHAKQVLY